ncbi:MAG: type II secretion system protein [Candidatus Portnoybacteria bacterium]|nr:type II secretion system protein [Candidatus Portnoybacteria bacterium]
MDKKGFTLIELVIYTAVFTIVTIMLTLFIFNLIRVQAKIRMSKEVSENTQRAMEIMLWEIKHAQSVYTPTSIFDSSPGQVTLETSQNAPAGEETTYIDFYLGSDDRLYLKREEQEAEALAPKDIKINALIFNYLRATGTDSIRIELSASHRSASLKPAYQATTTLFSSASLRND